MIQTKEVSIYNIEQKATRAGKTYWAITTNEGEISTWSIDVAKDIKEKCLNKVCSVGVKISDVNGKTYTNVMGIDRIISEAQPVQPKTQKNDIGESARLRRRTDSAIMATDLVIAKLVPLENLLDKAKAICAWIEEEGLTEDQIVEAKIKKLISPEKAFD